MGVELFVHRHGLLHVNSPRAIVELEKSHLVGGTYYIIGRVTYKHITITTHILLGRAGRC